MNENTTSNTLGKVGNVFHTLDIEAAICTQEEGQEMMDWSTSAMVGRSMGIDVAWGDTSKFAIVITQYRNNKVEVFYAESFEKPLMNEIINHIMQLKQRHHITKIYVDGANPVVTHFLRHGFKTDPNSRQIKRILTPKARPDDFNRGYDDGFDACSDKAQGLVIRVLGMFSEKKLNLADFEILGIFCNQISREAQTSETTINWGIIDYLFDHTDLKYLLIGEIDKLNKKGSKGSA